MITRHRASFYLSFLILLSFTVPTFASPLLPGDQKYTANFQGILLEVFTYKPNCPTKGILFVLHGMQRDAENYRNLAHPLADRLCMTVVTPLFDAKRFPSWRYQRGGIVHQNTLQKPDDWTGAFIPKLAAWVRQQEGQNLPYSIIGHSAGGQFLSRIAAFTPTEAKQIVIADPSTYVLASLEIQAPYGLGGVYPSDRAESELKRYLKMPVTILLGEEDVSDKGEIDNSLEAKAQGKNRYERGMNAFYDAQKLAQAHGWEFNWKLVKVPGVGHDAGRMLGSREAVEALGFPPHPPHKTRRPLPQKGER